MPGRLLIPQTASRGTGRVPGTYKMAFPGLPTEEAPAKPGYHGSFGRRFHNESRKVEPSKVSFEGPELERFITMSTDTISEDESSVGSSVTFTSSLTSRTSNTISDEDSIMMDFGRISTDFGRSSDVDFSLARHSTACCTDLALRRELRKKFHVEPTLDDGGLRDQSFAMGHSFRRKLEKEDRVESLALWEETDQLPAPRSETPRKVANATSHSWHAGDTASSMSSATYSSKNKGLESILRGNKKKTFFNGLFSGLSFSTYRKSRKSLG